MKLSSEFKKQIINALKTLEPEKLILFGSYAWGEPTENSDIDIVFVEKKEGFFNSFDERIQAKMKILKSLRELNFSFDVINYKKDEWAMLTENPSQFIKKIQSQGVIIE